MSPKDRHSYKVASSAKAADLLSAAPPRAAGAFGFGGFSGSRPIDTVRSSSASELSGDAGAPEVAISSDLNAEIAQHLRRLSKRDRTTKLKALQGLNALLAERSIADLTATLPAWAYVYNRLVLDNDRAVRLEASAVLGRLAGRVSRALAPFLKTLAGPWWLAQFDPHADAAAAARAAFQQAFAGPKQREALLFCHAEVVAYLEESLNARPEALGDVRKESAEEVAERGERVQAAALLALASLLDVCGPQQQPQPAQPPPGGTEQQAVVTRVQAVVGQAGFSKRMLASKSPLVRRAAYTLVTHLCTRALEVVLALDLGALVLGSFSDKDAGNHGAMWEMVLTYVRLRPDAWQAPHVQKMVLPRLHAFLRHGCYGSALTSYPAVLPLLSLMPQAVLGPEPGLLVEVLESIWAGRDGLAAGPAQDAAALAFQDCLRYGLTQAATLAGSAGPAAEAFGQALLQASFSRQVLPAGLQGSGAAPNAALRVVVAVAQHAAAAGPGSWQCRATLQHIGSAAVAALAAGLVSSEPAAVYDRALLLVDQLFHSTQRDCVKEWVAGPSAAAVASAVKEGRAPAQAASLLAALVKRFGASLMNGQAHGGVQQGNLPASSGEELTAADVAQRSVAGAAEGAIAEANADLLLSCLQRSPQAAEELASLCTQAAQTESGAPRKHGLAVASLWIRRLMQHEQQAGAPHSLAAWRSQSLDALAALLAQPDWLAAEPGSARLLGLLLGGSGTEGLLSREASCAVGLTLQQQLSRASVEVQQGRPADTCKSALGALIALDASLYKPATVQGCPSSWVQLLVSLASLAWQAEASKAEPHAGSDWRPSTSDSGEEADPGVQAGSALAETAAQDSVPSREQLADMLANAAVALWAGGLPAKELVHHLSAHESVSLRQAFTHSLLQHAQQTYGQQEQGRWVEACVVHASEIACLTCETPAETAELVAALLHPRRAWPRYAQLGPAQDSPQDASPSLAEAGASSSSYGPGPAALADLAAALCEAFGCPVVLDNLAASQSDNRVWLAVEVLCRCEEDEGLEGTARLLRDWLAGAPAQAAPAQGGSLVVEVLQRLLEGAAHSGENAAVFVGALCKLLEVLADSPGPGLATAQHFFAQHVVPASAHGVVSGALLRALLDEVAPAFRDGGDADGIADAGLTELTGALVEAVLARPPVTVLEGATMAACDALCTLLHCFPIGDRLSSAGAATAEERSSLLAVLQRQVGGRQAATAAAAALRRMALQAGAGPDADPEDQHPRDSVEVDAAVAELALRVVAYCWPIMTHQDWGAVLALLQAGVTAAALILEQRAEAVVGAVVAAAARLSTAAPPLPDVALQLLQRLNRLGLTQGSDKYKEAEAGLVAELADEGSGEALSRVAQAWLRTLALLLEVGRQPASQLAASEAWQAARHSLLSDALRLLFAKGICEAAASAGGVVTSAASVAWRSACRPLWDAVAQTTIAAASSSSEQAAVAQGIAEADAWAAETGVDACGSLLALLLTDQPHPGLQSAALKMLLGPDLVTRLSTAAVLVAKEEAEEAVGGGGDAVTLLTDAGVRVEVAAAVMHSQGTRSFLLAWAVLLAHLLAFAPGAPGCRHLAETIRGIHELVPTLLDMLSGHLPLAQQPTPPSGKRPIASKPGHSAAAAAAAAEDRRTIDWDFAADLQALGVPQCAADLPPLARLLYRAVLHALPSSARSWFMDLRDRSLAAAVEAYTAEHESPALLRREFALLQSPVAGSQDNFSIRTNPVTREVVSVMDVEDGARLEMVVRLPAAAPLRPPEVDCRRKVGVAEGRLRKWLLSITAFLRNQNGSVAEAIALWQRNVGKEFEGVEECLICYSVVSATDGKLPRLQCNTCSKKFHGACLYKWFKSSGKSNCPHCQSPW